MPVQLLVVLQIIYYVVMIAATIYSVVMALTRKSSVPNLLPSEIDNIPVAQAGKPIPVVFGRRYIRQPNVVWWGDVRVEPITMKTGGGSSS